jgi:hypothetical protein
MKWVERWMVHSHTNDEKEYTVSCTEDRETWGCSCPAWKFQRHRIRDGICKHIREVQNSILGMSEEEIIHSQNFYPAHIKRDAFFTEEDFTL